VPKLPTQLGVVPKEKSIFSCQRASQVSDRDFAKKFINDFNAKVLHFPKVSGQIAISYKNRLDWLFSALCHYFKDSLDFNRVLIRDALLFKPSCDG